jgi:hypothetical protein
MDAPVKLTIIGMSGSYPGPDSAASCYLVEQEHDGGVYRLVLDLGNGALGTLQRHVELDSVDRSTDPRVWPTGWPGPTTCHSTPG